MANIPTWTPVVALAHFDAEHRVLLQQRPAHKHHGGLWEFPGGKVELQENPRDALVRELEEELGIALDPAQLEPSHFAEEAGDVRVVLFLYISREVCGPPRALDGQVWKRLTLLEAAELALAPMDRALLHQLAR